MRILFLPMLPSGNAATRAFCDRPLSHLRELGFDGLVLYPAPDRLHRFVERRRRFRRLVRGLYWYGVVAPRRLAQIGRARRYDVVFVQRSLLHHRSNGWLEWLLARIARSTVVYHCDDALHVATGAGHYGRRMRLAECVLTGNRSIAEYAFRFNDNVYWLPGAVEADRYPVRRHCSRWPVVIGWAGHAAHAHLREIEPALRELATRRPVVLAVASDDAYALQGFAGEVRWERWSRDREYAFFGDLDIGVMPLLDTPYNRGKEGYKIKEYMAAGLPVVCSPVGYNAELVTPEVDGLHAVTHEDWVAALTRLVEDPELRARMGASGRAKATSQFDAAEQAVKLAQFVRRVASGARTDTGLIAWRSRLETDGC